MLRKIFEFKKKKDANRKALKEKDSNHFGVVLVDGGDKYRRKELMDNILKSYKYNEYFNCLSTNENQNSEMIVKELSNVFSELLSEVIEVDCEGEIMRHEINQMLYALGTTEHLLDYKVVVVFTGLYRLIPSTVKSLMKEIYRMCKDRDVKLLIEGPARFSGDFKEMLEGIGVDEKLIEVIIINEEISLINEGI